MLNPTSSNPLAVDFSSVASCLIERHDAMTSGPKRHSQPPPTPHPPQAKEIETRNSDQPC